MKAEKHLAKALKVTWGDKNRRFLANFVTWVTKSIEVFLIPGSGD